MSETTQRANVTLTLPAGVLREARHKAVDRGVSLSRYLAEVLEESLGKDRRYQRAMELAFEEMRNARSLGSNGTATWTRDELHER